MNINYGAVLVASVLQFIFSALWYTPVFGKLWGKIHGFDKVPKEKQKEMMKKMPPLLAVQMLSTVVTTMVLAIIFANMNNTANAYTVALLLWIGLIVPTQISAVLFGGTEPKWVITKLLIMTAAALCCIMIATAVLQAM